MIRHYLPRNTEDLIRWYERFISPLSLIAGFLMDNFVLLRRVDVWTSNALLGTYLVVAAACIVALNLIETGRVRNARALKVAPFIPVVAQFAFGGLFSGYLSLYSRSAAFPISWLFIAIVAVLLIGNERFRKLYVLPSFQIGVYYAALFSFLIFFLPVIFKSIGRLMFLASGLASLACIAVLLLILHKIVPEVVRARRTRMFATIASIYVLLNAFYFLNIIPPLPLALKEAGVYHSVVHTGDTYVLEGESLPWYKQFLPYNTIYTARAGESATVYTAMFAPSGLSTSIVHEWQHYDEGSGAWVTVAALAFPVTGGRDDGYRGYSTKSNVSEGRWRVNVLTGYGQLVGRVTFTVRAGTPVLTTLSR